MEKFKGTKGKWDVKHSESKPAFNIVGTLLGGKYKIARCPYMQDERFSKEYNDKQIDEAKANAKLIASAPEMLGMLEKLISHYGEDGYVGLALRSDIDDAKQLISKITE